MPENAKPVDAEQSEDQPVLALQEFESEEEGPEVEAHLSTYSINCGIDAD
jgi:hypothetical protein